MPEIPTLLPHQEQCKQFILQHPKCGVFLDIGYGKTLTTLAAIDILKPRNVLIVAPKSIARTTWKAEIKKWGYNFHVFSLLEYPNKKTGKMKQFTLKQACEIYKEIPLMPPDRTCVFITTRDRVKHLADWCEEHNTWPFDLIVADEFHNFKGNTNRSNALLQLSQHTPRFVGLTGTPMPNSISDLWGEIRILDNGARLGRYISHFRAQYMIASMTVQGHPVAWKPIPGAEDLIYPKIADIAISVKTDLKLPPLTINDMPIYLDQNELQIYRQFAKSGVLNLEDIDPLAAMRSGEDYTVLTPANAAALVGKLSQIASGTVYDEKHNAYVIHNQKLDKLQQIVDNTGGPVLVAYHFKCDRKRIMEHLTFDKEDIERGNATVVEFNGSMDMQDAWNRGEYRVMLIQPQKHGAGINLQQGGSTLVWYSLPTSYEQYAQTNGRIYRQGQTKPTIIHRLITQQTFDTRLAVSLLRKGEGNDAVLEAVRREIYEIMNYS